VLVGDGLRVGGGAWVRVAVIVGDGVIVAVTVEVGGAGVKVGRGVGVSVGVGDWYQRGVEVGVIVGGMIGEGVIKTSGGYNCSIAVCQSNPPVMTNSLKRAAG